MDVYGLIGNPVTHSRSPPMHEAAYDARDITARYVTFEPSEDAVEAAIDGAAALDINGLNVTIPFKQAVMEYIDPDPLAGRIGAVNMIDFETEPPTGYNTDIDGVQRAFDHHDIELNGTEAVVIGAGGVARAAAFALSDAGASIHIANRTEPKATQLAQAVPGATAGGLQTRDRVESADILINATSVGMESTETPVPRTHLHANLVVFDAVYTPVETTLLQQAEAAGATTIDGAWMLLFQGVTAFEHWTGEAAPVEVMNAALRETL